MDGTSGSSSGSSGASAKGRLLDAAIDYVAEHGIADLSLRGLAAAIGTSHRMLIFYFGSKEQLWAGIARTVAQRQGERLRELVPEPTGPYSDALRTWWRHISDPVLWPHHRLFFELYGQALQGRPHTNEFLDGVVDDWLKPVVETNVARGAPEGPARAHARLSIAVTRGLLLDLLATGDVASANQAMEAFICLYEAWLPPALQCLEEYPEGGPAAPPHPG